MRCKLANSLISVPGGQCICLVQMFRELPPPFASWDQETSLFVIAYYLWSKVKPLVCFTAFHGWAILPDVRSHCMIQNCFSIVVGLPRLWLSWVLHFFCMLAPSFLPFFPLHFWIMPIDRIWGREERGDTPCFSLLSARWKVLFWWMLMNVYWTG